MADPRPTCYVCARPCSESERWFEAYMCAQCDALITALFRYQPIGTK